MHIMGMTPAEIRTTKARRMMAPMSPPTGAQGVARTAPSGQIDTKPDTDKMKAMSKKTKPPKPKVKSITVASQGMCNSPGLWRLFEHARKTEPKKWLMDFLAAFFNDRATVKQREAMIRGEFLAQPSADGSITISVTTERTSMKTFPPFEKTEVHTRQGDYVLTAPGGMLVYGRVMMTRVPDCLRLTKETDLLRAAVYAVVLERKFGSHDRDDQE